VKAPLTTDHRPLIANASLLSSTTHQNEHFCSCQLRTSRYSTRQSHSSQSDRLNARAAETDEMRLLIVEDNYQMRRLIKSIVASLCDEVRECGDGSEALEAYTKLRPDWVLMDVEMPTLDGISATREIKAVFPEARIVIVTEHNNPDLRDESRNVGACWYVLKDSLWKLREILQGRQIDPKEI
jgi:CheY-like chemotaxis protein